MKLNKKKLPVQKTIENANSFAIHNPRQGIENCLEVAVNRAIGGHTVMGVGSQIANWDELLGVFMEDTNQEMIAAGRAIRDGELEQMEVEATENPLNQKIDAILEPFGLGWGVRVKTDDDYSMIYTEDIGIPDGVYEGKYEDYGYFRGDLTNTGKKIRVENGKVNVADVAEVFGKEFSKYDDHTYISGFELVDGILKIDCSS